MFPSIERASNGTRLFNEENIETFYMIECLNLFIEKQHMLESEMKRLQECIDAVKYKVWYYKTTQKAGTISVHDNMPPEDIPKNMQEIRSHMVSVKRLTENPE